jgi:acetyltransferase-like isoleucine patch superfamily enzyme/coenzyme F420-reducing hydrogenase beta subunit
MIRIDRREDCSGCSACVDACRHGAIELAIDEEGFWYPHVNASLCMNCGSCERTCPQLHAGDLKSDRAAEPAVYAAYCRDGELRRESTSGGIFSTLANAMYDRGGYVGGAVYSEELTAKHLVSGNRDDLGRIRGSKYSQSHTAGVFRQVEKILVEGGQVLICGAPCQIAGLRLYLGKEYEGLVTVDFVCAGMNSPKIFRKYLESLERVHGARVVSIQSKNKDQGWRSLGCKVTLSDGRTCLRLGRDDDFVRGFIEARCFCRPVCYECKYRGFPRISDITLGDFWGIEKVDRTMDDNKGTSVVLANTPKGKVYYESLKDAVVSKEVKLTDVLPWNPALVSSFAVPALDRTQYYADVDKLGFEVAAKKYYPSNGKLLTKVRKRFGSVGRLIAEMGWSPKPYMQCLAINLLRKNTQCEIRKGRLIYPGRHVVMDIHRQAQLTVKGSILIGYTRIKGSKMETRVAVEGRGALRIEKGKIVVFYGTEIHVFDGGTLTLAGDATINQKVQIICMDNITIGHDVMIARDVVIRDNDGGHEILAAGYKKTAPVIIGNHVWIGQGAMIMKGVTIGDGAVIGAGAWVIKDVKPKTLVLGDPARAVQKEIEWKR